jgi:hypothetical protein
MAIAVNTGESNEPIDPDRLFPGLMKERTPEKSDALDATIAKHKIRFVVDEDAERVFFRSSSGTGLVTVGMIGSARLMAHAFAYWACYFIQLSRLARSRDGSQVPSDEQNRIINANHLLTWAVTEDVRNRLPLHERGRLLAYIPYQLDELVGRCLPRELLPVGLELFQNALVWILYHEIAHIQLGHVACEGLVSLEQEKEADRLAAEWLIGDEKLTAPESSKRKLGIATALGWLTAPTVYKKSWKRSEEVLTELGRMRVPTVNVGPSSMLSHPYPHDRLYQVLEQYLQAEDEEIWMFVVLILRLHLQNAGCQLDESRIGTDMKANVNYLIDIIAQADEE